MEKKKKKRTSYFEVSPKEAAWLTVAAVVATVAMALTHWADVFGPTGGGYGGLLGRWTSQLMWSPLGGGLVKTVGAAATVLLLERMRRGMRRAGSRAWTLVALWQLLIGVAAVIGAVPGANPLYAYAHVPTAWDAFRDTFLQNERVVAGCVQLGVALAAMVGFGGRVRAYGASLVACPVASAALLGALMPQWAAADHPDTALAFLWQAVDLVADLVPLLLLRLTMSPRVAIGEEEGDGDVSAFA